MASVTLLWWNICAVYLVLETSSLTPSSIIGSEDTRERHTQIPVCQGVSDFGPLPRERYPLVAVLTLAEPEDRNIVSGLIGA